MKIKNMRIILSVITASLKKLINKKYKNKIKNMK